MEDGGTSDMRAAQDEPFVQGITDVFTVSTADPCGCHADAVDGLDLG